METNIQIFKNSQFGEVRVTEIHDEPMFAAADVCKILGYTNTSKAITDHTEPDERYNETLDRGGNMLFINESGLYSLIIRSNKDEAKPFRKWVTSEVLPSIRRHGGYLTPQKIEEALLNPDTLIQLATNLKEERQKRLEAETKVELQQKRIAILEPKAQFMDRVMDTDQKIDIGQAAKILGLPFGRNTLFVKLREKGVFFKTRNEPKQEYIDKDYFELKEKWIDCKHHSGFIVTKVLVTQRGLDFIAKLFEAVQDKKSMMKLQTVKI